ncbi:hypothetical protein J4456_04425 [Candidatus Pacearchaeota archaeon]|nr:hypothetical protein [Candidatus Pacearchaeota archaeon]
MNQEEIYSYLKRASKLPPDPPLFFRLNAKNRYRVKDEWEEKKIKVGAKKFKGKIFGFFGFKKSKVKSLDELAQDLVEVGMVNDINEGEKLIPQLIGYKIAYASYYLPGDGHWRAEKVCHRILTKYLELRKENKEIYRFSLNKEIESLKDEYLKSIGYRRK